MKAYIAPSFRPVGGVLQSSYAQVKNTFSLLFQVLLVRLLVEGVLFGIFLSLFLTVGVGSVLSHLSLDQTIQSMSYFSVFSVYNTWIFMLGMLFLGIVYVGASSVLFIATMIAVSRPKKTLSLSEIFHMSIQRFVPFVATQLLCLFFIVGGFFACIVPGIGMLLAFTFVPFIVIFEKKSGFEAMKRSLSLLSQHPFTLLGRILLLWGMGIVLFLFFLTTFFQSLPSFIQLAVFLTINICFWWYSIAYSYLLYKEATMHTKEYSFSLTQVCLLAVSGWVLVICISISIFQMVKSGSFMTFHHDIQEGSYTAQPAQSYSIKDI